MQQHISFYDYIIIFYNPNYKNNENVNVQILSFRIFDDKIKYS